MNQQCLRLLAAMCCAMSMTAIACGQQEQQTHTPSPAHSYLSGNISVSADIDATEDYGGFEILVAVDDQGEPDTLGHGITSMDGSYGFPITAPSRGIYALLISRNAQILKVDEIAVAENDTATLNVTFPIGNRPLRIRSLENAAWAAYQNTRTQHNNRLLELVQGDKYTNSAVQHQVGQTTTILWEMQHTFPNTMGSEAALAEAVIMSAGWNDSLTVARAQSIAPSNVNYADVGRAARQAQARYAGQEDALALVRSFRNNAVHDDQRAQLQSELVLAHMDSLEYDEALQEAHSLEEMYSESAWAEWARRAIYELEHLLPGMVAPDFAVNTTTGEVLALEDLQGKHAVLEFYRPQDTVYQRELEGRNALLEEAGSDVLNIISISVEPDTVINDAFFEERVAPGYHVYASDNTLLESYNVNVLPTRFLLGPEGKIIAKYAGAAMAALLEDTLLLLQEGE